jgi:type I restriction enzyme R subunit
MTSQNLKLAIEQGKKVIVTTLQKFSVICDEIAHYPNRNYAIIIDEAHSSQTGDAARDMRKALSLAEAQDFDQRYLPSRETEDAVNLLLEEDDKRDNIDAINSRVSLELKRKTARRNISFYAFTATPKSKTIEIFCEHENGQKTPFDVYSMEDAINEGFIRDVLENYTSFRRYYKLVRDTRIDDKEYDKKKAIRLLSNYVDIQEAAIERKSRIMVEHFATQTATQIEGQARAMLVTRSRLHAVRYKRMFDKIMQEMHLPYGCLVAFSGSVYDSETDMDYTEASMNQLEGNIDIPDAFKGTPAMFFYVALISLAFAGFTDTNIFG